ncbi:hypothetical protein AB0C59_11620 [Streptomyces sp. NPDC048664]|uniref:hypothetical protein n=1 Tax=Streptomyces sp. NPDC048664 TaxID=3154505 RepID=UPI003417ECB9
MAAHHGLRPEGHGSVGQHGPGQDRHALDVEGAQARLQRVRGAGELQQYVVGPVPGIAGWTSVAPNRRASSRRSAAGSTAVTEDAPAKAAAATAVSPSMPAPTTTTRLPSRRGARSTTAMTVAVAQAAGAARASASRSPTTAIGMPRGSSTWRA